MHAILLAIALMFPSHTSAGLLVADPEYFGAWGSVWPSTRTSLDARLTMSTIDGGITGHFPIAANLGEEHDILVTGMAGWTHDLIENHYWDAHHGFHLMACAGYGYRSAWDIRLLGGVTSYESPFGWARGYTLVGMVGRFF